jgi:hypothetical protein
MTMKKVPAAAAGTFVFSAALSAEILAKILILNDEFCVLWQA